MSLVQTLPATQCAAIRAEFSKGTELRQRDLVYSATPSGFACTGYYKNGLVVTTAISREIIQALGTERACESALRENVAEYFKVSATLGKFPDAVVEQIARMTHEINRSYCAALGDHSQLPWDEAPEWQRDSAIKGVRFNLENPDAPPSASHESWYAEKEAAGWVYGPVKDPEAKEHPCMVPYEELPVEQKAKDYLFKSVVANMATYIQGSVPKTSD